MISDIYSTSKAIKEICEEYGIIFLSQYKKLIIKRVESPFVEGFLFK